MCAILWQTITSGTIIDSGIRRQNFILNENSKQKTLDNGSEGNDDLADTQCSISPELIKEIKSYQPIVNKIVGAVVNGENSGSTWKR